MHIPDGFLDLKTAAASGVLAAAAVAVSIRSAGTSRPRTIPLMGLTGAFIFAAQMVNFPVGPGTSGHLMGGALAAVLLGPAGAVVTMTAVLVVQCVLFADGGITSLGANILNIAVAAPVIGGWIAGAVRRSSPKGSAAVAAAAFGGWCSTVAAAALCAGELAWSGTVPWTMAFPAMVNIHMVIGLGEAAITGVILASILRLRPELLNHSTPDPTPGSDLPGRRGVVTNISMAMILLSAGCLFIAPFASPLPDGLEKVAASLGFDRRSLPPATAGGPFADYRVPGISSAVTSTLIAGAIGTVTVFGLSFVLAKALSRRHGAL